MPTIAVQAMCVAILIVLLVSFMSDIKRAPEEKKRKYQVGYSLVVLGGVVLFLVLNVLNVSERVFPWWYEQEQLRQDYNKAQSEPFNPDNYTRFDDGVLEGLLRNAEGNAQE